MIWENYVMYVIGILTFALLCSVGWNLLWTDIFPWEGHDKFKELVFIIAALIGGAVSILHALSSR